MPAAADARSIAAAGVPTAVVQTWLTTFALYEWMRLKLGSPLDASGAGPLALIEAVTLYEIVQLGLLALIALRVPAASRLHPLEALFLTAVGAFLMLPGGQPIVVATAIALLVAARFAWSSATSALALGLSAFLIKYNPVPAALNIHAVVAEWDAALLAAILADLGVPIIRQGTIIAQPAIGFGVDVQTGCATSSAVIAAVSGYVLMVLALRGRLVWALLLDVTLLVTVVWLVNLARLTPMAISREGHAYWHEGEGAQIVAAAFMALALGAGWLSALRRTP